LRSCDLSPSVQCPRQERSRAALSTIMAAAADVLARKGHDGFSMTEIAEAAGMAVANIYRRFESKDSIVQALALYNFQRLEEQIVADTRCVRRRGGGARSGYCRLDRASSRQSRAGAIRHLFDQALST